MEKPIKSSLLKKTNEPRRQLRVSRRQIKKTVPITPLKYNSCCSALAGQIIHLLLSKSNPQPVLHTDATKGIRGQSGRQDKDAGVADQSCRAYKLKETVSVQHVSTEDKDSLP